jgi:hypothetical protein
MLIRDFQAVGMEAGIVEAGRSVRGYFQLAISSGNDMFHR